ncbi:MAG: cupredoxin domain-containing protein, partial [Nitrososphaera sp.]
MVSHSTFIPETLVVRPGAAVIWTNMDPIGHTVTSGNAEDKDAGSLFDSGFPLLKTDENWEQEFGAPGTFRYFCRAH